MNLSNIIIIFGQFFSACMLSVCMGPHPIANNDNNGSRVLAIMVVKQPEWNYTFNYQLLIVSHIIMFIQSWFSSFETMLKENEERKKRTEKRQLNILLIR